MIAKMYRGCKTYVLLVPLLGDTGGTREERGPFHQSRKYSGMHAEESSSMEQGSGVRGVHHQGSSQHVRRVAETSIRTPRRSSIYKECRRGITVPGAGLEVQVRV